ncbi:MAG: SRPBCC family protein [Bdellovibrionales bacterium]
MGQEAKVKVQATHRYNAPAERIYDTLLDPNKAKKFMFRTLTGKVVKAEIDARPGGSFVFVERRPSGDAEHYGEYVTLDRPKRVAFRFAVQKNAPESDLVTIDVTQLKQGCEVTLTHEIKAEFAHLSDRVQEGWDGILDGLGEALRT